MKCFILLLLIFISVDVFAATGVSRKSDDDITEDFAIQRKGQIEKVDYRLSFELFKAKDEFKGLTEIDVTLKNVDLPLSIDLTVTKINSIKINDKEIKNYPYRKGSFDIPAKYLSKKMKIEIAYTGNYSKESGGFLKAVDPEDNSEYMYTTFEPYYAHKLFPCFDQPDLKATYDLKVKSPRDWTIISNEIVAEKTELTNDEVLTIFKTTPQISSYLFFLGAGPFVEWTEQEGKIPLTLYARKSIAKYVDYKEIFATTKKGLRFFNEYFDYHYPFSKYGQVFVPEFSWGGMENPGAVTLNERNIFRGPVPRSKYEDRDNLILHEMAHMWFGDLVTMHWWNDLWLNESFATYLATIAQNKAIGSDAAWMDFFSTKTWGYWQDQLITTHPIETHVPDVRTAKSNFDGITYAKGAAALKQLHFYVGEDGFRDGLRAYFKKFAFKNTARKDFIDSIGNASNKDLSDWTKKWLQSAGLNRVSVNFSCKEGTISEMTLKQGKSISKTLSPHRTQLGLYRLEDQKLKLNETVEVTYSEEMNKLNSFIHKKCPDFILPNQGDQDYAIFTLDAISLQNAKRALISLPDSLSRMMVWTVLGQMVRDAEVRPVDYFDLVLGGLAVEKDDLLLGNLLGRNSPVRDLYFLYLSKEERELLAPRLEELLTSRVNTAEKGSSLQMAYFDFFVSIAQTKKSQDQLYSMLTANNPPKGIVLDQDRRWSIITNLSFNGHSSILKLSEDESKKDNSTLGTRMALAVSSAYPDLSSKKAMWKKMLTEDLPYSNFREAASRFHGPNQEEFSSQFVEEFFAKVTTIDWKKHDSVLDIYFEKLFPLQLCSKSVLDLSQKKLRSAKNLTSVAKRSWMESQDELSRCVRVGRNK